MLKTKAPTMKRSRSQLASVYAPHSLFTFEGGVGACMARPVPNPTYEPAGSAGTTTKRMIHEQIIEFVEAWLQRATTGQNPVVPVSPERALDGRALRKGAVHLPIGSLHFQVPECVGYLPFPTAFFCNRCGLHRHCEGDANFGHAAARFRDACPSGRARCADDWQQLDVVMAHWSGAVEALTPLQRRVNSSTLEIESYPSCSTCYGQKFYLRRNGATFSRWHFECADCGTLREIQLKDRATLEDLKQHLVNGANVRPQINMEPVSYRASAAYYPQGDRLLVFRDDQWISLLQAGNSTRLGHFLAASMASRLQRRTMLNGSASFGTRRPRGRMGRCYIDLRDLIRTMEPAALRY